jgi:hypothetical protein
MSKCQFCERPDSLCECYESINATPMKIPVFHKDRTKPNGEVDAVRVAYGTCKVKRVAGSTISAPSSVDAGSQYTTFPDVYQAGGVEWAASAMAGLFAQFLNSDAIFDCKVPRHFLR